MVIQMFCSNCWHKLHEEECVECGYFRDTPKCRTFVPNWHGLLSDINAALADIERRLDRAGA